MKNKHILFITFSLLLPITTYASCTKEDIQEFKNNEKNIYIKYERDSETNQNALIIKNIDFDKYTISEIGMCTKDTNKMKCTNIQPGNYQLILKGNTETCNEKLKTYTIKVEKDNPFYNDPLCKGIKEFVLCQPTYDKDIDYDTFVTRIETYKKSKEKQEEKEKQEKINKIKDYFQNNLSEIIIITIFIILVIITIILTYKSSKKGRRLE